MNGVLNGLRETRWFAGKSRAVAGTRVVDRAQWTEGAWVSLLEISYASGPAETYVLADRFEEAAVARAVLGQFRRRAKLRTEEGGSLVYRPTHVLEATRADRLEPIRAMHGEQSNSSIRFGDGLILKLFRRLQFGPHPDVEVGWFLTEHTHFLGTPPVAGSLSYLSRDGREASLALLQRFEPNRGDAWTTMLARLAHVLDGADPAESIEAVRRLGETTAELHLALASGTGDFGPEPILDEDVDAWRRTIQDELQMVAAALAQRGVTLEVGSLLRRADGIGALHGALKARHHGDYHLGQVLERDDGTFAIIDFEGEPSRPLGQRREKRSPLRDVAGMLRSFDYARMAAVRAGDVRERRRVDTAGAWYAWARSAFLDAYLAKVRQVPGLLPRAIDAPLAALELEKASYEVLYELNNRPDWVPIPLEALTAV
ncbi:MAG TPA: hypothetical protein VF937_09230 [Chloroflexota bacterium]